MSEHIIIGSDRFITVPDSLKRIAVQNDHDVIDATFDCPRYWDGRDLSTMDIYVSCLRPDTYKKRYPVKNIVVDGNMIHFDWTITSEVCYVNGDLIFLVCADKTVDGVIENHWNSELCYDMYVTEGLECQGIELGSDLATYILMRMNKLENAIMSGGSDEPGGDDTTQTGGSSLPDVSAGDTGTILQTRDGEWTMIKAPCYSEFGGEIDVLSEQELVFSSLGNGLYIWQGASYALVEDATYKVLWNAQEYTCTAVEATLESTTGVGLGNLSLVGLSGGNNEPFAFGYDPTNGAILCYTTMEGPLIARIYQVDRRDMLVNKEYMFSKIAASDIVAAGTTKDVLLEVGKTYGLIIDGKAYTCNAFKDGDTIVIGDVDLNTNGSASDDPFLIFTASTLTSIFLPGTEDTNHIISLYELAETVHPLPEKYLPAGIGGGLNEEEVNTLIKNYVDSYIDEALGGDY